MKASSKPEEALMWNAPDAVRFTDSAGVNWRVVDYIACDEPNERVSHS